MTTLAIDRTELLKQLVSNSLNGLSDDHLVLVWSFITGILEASNKDYEEKAIAAIIEEMTNEIAEENLQ